MKIITKKYDELEEEITIYDKFAILTETEKELVEKLNELISKYRI